MKYPFLIGCYGSAHRDNIYGLSFDSETGRISHRFSAGGVKNPSYLLCNGNILYSVCECPIEEKSGVCVWDHAGNGLSLRQEVRFSEGGACHLMLCETSGRLFVANYDTGSDIILTLRSDGSLVETPSVVRHLGCNPGNPRQEAPHAHGNTMTTSPYRMVSVDLGGDVVTVNNIMPAGGQTFLRECSRLDLPKGSGPRHIVFSKMELAYLVTELSNKVYKLDFHAGSGSLWNLGEASTLPADFCGKNTAAAIKLSPDERYLAVSNRGHDSIMIYGIAPDGSLHNGVCSPSEGACPRDIAFTPDGNYLACCCQEGNCVNLFRFDRDTHRLNLCDKITLAAPACVVVDPSAP